MSLCIGYGRHASIEELLIYFARNLQDISNRVTDCLGMRQSPEVDLGLKGFLSAVFPPKKDRFDLSHWFFFMVFLLATSFPNNPYTWWTKTEMRPRNNSRWRSKASYILWWLHHSPPEFVDSILVLKCIAYFSLYSTIQKVLLLAGT